MIVTRRSSFSHRLLFFTLIIALLLGSNPIAAQPPQQAAWGKRGQAAINALGQRLSQVAGRHGMSAEVLRNLFQNDSNLWLDNQDQLVYLDEYLPQQAATPGSSTTISAQGPLPYDQTFQMHSLPGASKVIYLDFDGHTTSGTAWNSNFTGGAPIASAPFDLDGNPSNWSTAEMDRIQYIWQRVAEDFLPFNVDVTTQDPGAEALRNAGSGDQYYGVRVVISPTNWYNVNAGGVAYLGSFNWNSDTPCFVFSGQLGNGHEKYVAEAISHEAGHTVGLSHDGQTNGTAYYQGHGTEPLGWAPIMGASYYRSITQWSKGEYSLANNTQDDLTVMTTSYGFSYRTDDHGNSIGSASALTTSGGNVSGKGIIERTTDKDYFSFVTGSGTITLNISPGPRSPNLDIKAELLNSSGALVTSSDLTGLPALISLNVPAGTYYLVVDGVGTGDPTTGYSDYASLGEFNISGTIVESGAPNAAASATPTSGNAPLVVAFSSAGSSDPDGTITSYAWNFGNGATSTSANPSYTYTVPGTFTAVLTVTDNSGLTDTASVVITVNGPPSAPTNLTASAASTSQINLNWTDSSNNETGFKIERSTDNANWAQITTVAANVTSYSNTGLNAATLYYYRVRSYNGSGDSGYSNTANATTFATIHVGDLEGASAAAGANRWNATVTITVHKTDHGPMAGVTVSGSWGGGTSGSASCTTNAAGQCSVTKANLKNSLTSVTFTVSNLSQSGSTYVSGSNHDADGDSTGTTITVRK